MSTFADRTTDELFTIEARLERSYQFALGNLGAREQYRLSAQLSKVRKVLDDRYADEEQEGPTCSICDALGHGYPGGGPCPLEERGANEPDERY